MEIEEWRPIPDADGYEASSLGRIRSLDRTVSKTSRNGTVYECMIAGRVLKPWIAGGGYLYVDLSSDGLKGAVHRFVCAAFYGASEKEVAHGNGCKTDNHVSNLRWATHAENMQDQRLHGTHLLGKSHPFKIGQKRRGSKPSKHPCATTIRILRDKGTPLAALATLFGMSTSGMFGVVKCRI